MMILPADDFALSSSGETIAGQKSHSPILILGFVG
jgi:hypothetical protein